MSLQQVLSDEASETDAGDGTVEERAESATALTLSQRRKDRPQRKQVLIDDHSGVTS